MCRMSGMQGIGCTSWKKRWFILTNNSLIFYINDLNVHAQKSGEIYTWWSLPQQLRQPTKRHLSKRLENLDWKVGEQKGMSKLIAHDVNDAGLNACCLSFFPLQTDHDHKHE